MGLEVEFPRARLVLVGVVHEDEVHRIYRLKVDVDLCVWGDTVPRDSSHWCQVERVEVDKDSILSYDRFQGSVHFLLKEKHMCEQLKGLDSVLPAPTNTNTVPSII